MIRMLAISSLGLFMSTAWTAPQSGLQPGQLAGKIFDAMDSNHDGKIIREEMDAVPQKQPARVRDRFRQRFDAADANHDGVLSRSEAAKMPGIAQRFDEIDANHDGQVTQQEFAAAFKSARRARQQPQ